jgi:hypothetical protein
LDGVELVGHLHAVVGLVLIVPDHPVEVAAGLLEVLKAVLRVVPADVT